MHNTWTEARCDTDIFWTGNTQYKVLERVLFFSFLIALFLYEVVTHFIAFILGIWAKNSTHSIRELPQKHYRGWREREREGGQAGGVWAELWHGGGMQRERPHNGRCSFHCYDPTHLYLKIPETVKALQSHRKSRQPALMGKQQHNSNWTPPIKHCRHSVAASESIICVQAAWKEGRHLQFVSIFVLYSWAYFCFYTFKCSFTLWLTFCIN